MSVAVKQNIFKLYVSVYYLKLKITMNNIQIARYGEETQLTLRNVSNPNAISAAISKATSELIW